MTLRVCAPDIFSGDAVGNHCFGLMRLAHRIGVEAALYAEHYDMGTPGVRPLEALFADTTGDDVLLLCYSIADPNLERLLALDCRKICYFHGVTDPDLLREFEPRTALLCEAALAQLPLLARFDAVVANSHDTARKLAHVRDVKAVKAVPPVFGDQASFTRVLPKKARKLREPNLLMVGRVVPHKRIEDGVEVLALLRERGFNATLTLVGTAPNYDYLKFLINHARRLGVLERVDFKGMVDDADLLDCYENTSALLALSRHEGFCVPVLEAQHLGKPVFVRGGTAAAEICPAESVFAPDADLAEWASAIAQRLGTGAATNRANPAHTAYADSVLERASDAVWSEILAGVGTTGHHL
jgi:glycosyltransferase involved in cell wall biosynthesis